MLVHLAGVELTPEGRVWLQENLAPAQTVWLKLISRQDDVLHCLVRRNRVSWRTTETMQMVFPPLFLSLCPLPPLVSPAGVSVEPLRERGAPLARPGAHRARPRGPARLSRLLASPQTAAQGRGQSREEGAGPVAAGQRVGEGL